MKKSGFRFAVIYSITKSIGPGATVGIAIGGFILLLIGGSIYNSVTEKDRLEERRRTEEHVKELRHEDSLKWARAHQKEDVTHKKKASHHKTH